MNEDLLADLALQVGGLVEISVFETTVADWQHVADLLRESPYAATLTRAENPVALQVYEGMFSEGADIEFLLEFRIGEQVWTSHMQAGEEISFQGDPRDITSQQELENVVRFMCTLHSVTGKKVVFLPETLRPLETKPYVTIP